MESKIINTEEDYRKSLEEVERLIAHDPKPGTPEAARLELLAKSLAIYEKERFHFELPDPIEAIRFRMEEQGLMQRDLVPYIGSKSKVSEVLSGKRPLTIQMIRALHSGLGIPAEVLLQEPKKPHVEDCIEINWQKFPIVEMVKRGWITAKIHNVREHAEELMKRFIEPLGKNIEPALCRRTIHKRSKQDMDRYSLLAWTARVLIRAKEEYPQKTNYKHGTFTKDFLREIARLSWFDKGPLLAKEFLGKSGIALIIEPSLPKTKLDGGAMLTEEGCPVIGMTLRHDRLDNFWYTLLHELAHISKHLKTTEDTFIDDLDTEDAGDLIEKEADKLTRETFIPRSVWLQSEAYSKQTGEAVKTLAEKLRIHPAIIAGRIRYETKNYQILNDLLGRGEVSKLFKS